jgi:hypothetical protein
MVGFHVVDDEVVQLTPIECCSNVLKELLADGEVGGVQQGGLLVEQHVAVVRYAPRNGVYVLKESYATVTDTDID